MANWLSEHPVVSTIGALLFFVVWTLPQWLSSVWSLFSSQPFVDVMQERKWGALMIGPAYGWISVVIGAFLVGIAIYAVVAPSPDQKMGVYLVSRPAVTELRDAPNGKSIGAFVLLSLAVTNRGESSPASDWRVALIPYGSTEEIQLAVMADFPSTVSLAAGREGDSKPLFEITTRQLLPKVTLTDIQPDQAVQGFLVSKLPTADSVRAGKMIVRFRDRRGTQYSLDVAFAPTEMKL